MSKIQFFCLFLTFFGICLTSSQFRINSNGLSYQEQLKEITRRLEDQRYNQQKDFKFFPPQFYEMKGLYSSNIHGNAMDKNNTFFYHLIREYVGCPDSNMFVTNFVLSAMLDCAELGTIEIDQEKFEESIDAILQFRDKNQKEGIPSYSFWKQNYKNGTWYSYPQNLQKVAEMIKIMPDWAKKLLIKLGLPFVAVADKIADAFHLPPDADDSSVNIALGIRIMNSPLIRQSIKEKWIKSNHNLQEYYQLLKKYSYKPFDVSNSSVNTLDVRTYFAFHNYLQTLNKTSNFSVFTTWIRSTDDQIPSMIEIPGNTNNFDCSVISNTLFGLHNILLNSNQTVVNEIFDEELQGLYLNSTNVIIYAIDSYISKSHPDIAFLYYPSVYDFYWFVARNVHLLNSNYDKIPNQLIKDVVDALNKSMKNQGTIYILNNTLADKNGNLYWQEFLGIYNNKTYHEDETFSTVMALNALIDIWTISKTDENGKVKRIFDSQTPQNVTTTIQKGMQTLLKKNSFSKSNQNAFFSGSFKSLNTLSIYPMNVNHYLNGTEFDPHTADFIALQQVKGVKGIIDEKEYQEMLKQKWFNLNVIEEFTGYNSQILSYPYWSSPAITYSMGASLISKYQSLQSND
ncbi:hypothetical protein TTHERM_000985179 (macronuclear) [Tetrahymena thermophila SB210]|uniref:Transmembrane protein n=1 Tax=Tetrahymena thermophila (strain SB210) TaxID=312017 RepID=W7X7T5_TETTS|nr:hypothetical protein TTHERM_000985179 [Tetrahymena thermophila SB210]EWS75435.1 hypothetical protein TTHERM_000985179 [Tetrahymena thermophila SB210]|eukprot:XP_012652020.1 hypothetical protein TTHERM_000985179 [Tetrahymena thermophila SB210]